MQTRGARSVNEEAQLVAACRPRRRRVDSRLQRAAGTEGCREADDACLVRASHYSLLAIVDSISGIAGGMGAGRREKGAGTPKDHHLPPRDSFRRVEALSMTKL